MKITRLRTEVVHLPFGSAIKQEGFGELRSIDCVLVYLDTDTGLVGEGLVYSINASQLLALHEAVRSFEPLLSGLDPEFGGTFISRANAATSQFGSGGCVYRKPKSAHNGDEARRGPRATRCPRRAGEDETRGRLCPATGAF